MAMMVSPATSLTQRPLHDKSAASGREQTAHRLAFVNGHVVTCDEGTPEAEALVVEGSRIVMVGSTRAVIRTAGGSARAVDVGGRTIIPGLVDSHCHLFGSAAARLSIDCGTPSNRSLGDVLALVEAAAATQPDGEWIYAARFDEVLVAERRFPTRRELDEVAPHTPVELKHSSGHAVVLNTLACDLLGVPSADRGDGVFYDTAVPERRDRRRTVEIESELALLSREWLRFGTTFVQDVGVDNGPSEYAALAALVDAGVILQRVGLLVRPPGRPADSSAARATASVSEGDVRVTGIKLAVSEATLSSRTLSVLNDRIREAAAASRLVGIHVVELGALAALLDLLERLKADDVNLDRVRLEHVSVCPPDWAARLASLGVIVVTQPAFLVERGERYHRLIGPEEHSWLFPTGDLLRAGVNVAGSSDSPVGGANPFSSMAAAIQRRSRDGARFAGNTSIPRSACLRLYTTAGAKAVDRDQDLGRLAAGYLADFAILDRDPLTVPVEELPQTRAVATYVNGEGIHGLDWVEAATVA